MSFKIETQRFNLTTSLSKHSTNIKPDDAFSIGIGLECAGFAGSELNFCWAGPLALDVGFLCKNKK